MALRELPNYQCPESQIRQHENPYGPMVIMGENIPVGVRNGREAQVWVNAPAFDAILFSMAVTIGDVESYLQFRRQNTLIIALHHFQCRPSLLSDIYYDSFENVIGFGSSYLSEYYHLVNPYTVGEPIPDKNITQADATALEEMAHVLEKELPGRREVSEVIPGVLVGGGGLAGFVAGIKSGCGGALKFGLGGAAAGAFASTFLELDHLVTPHFGDDFLREHPELSQYRGNLFQYRIL